MELIDSGADGSAITLFGDLSAHGVGFAIVAACTPQFAGGIGFTGAGWEEIAKVAAFRAGRAYKLHLSILRKIDPGVETLWVTASNRITAALYGAAGSSINVAIAPEATGANPQPPNIDLDGEATIVAIAALLADIQPSAGPVGFDGVFVQPAIDAAGIALAIDFIEGDTIGALGPFTAASSQHLVATLAISAP